MVLNLMKDYKLLISLSVNWIEKAFYFFRLYLCVGDEFWFHMDWK